MNAGFWSKLDTEKKPGAFIRSGAKAAIGVESALAAQS